MLFHQLALVAAVCASPLEKRLLNTNDRVTLNTLLYLENVQSSLYNIGCNNFTDSDYSKAGFPVGFRQNICFAAQQGLAHAASITSSLVSNSAPVIQACTYQFQTVSNPSSFVSLMTILNTVVESAYLGTAEYLTDIPGTDEIAASIGAVKARQGGFLRSFSGAVPFPAAFDTALTQAYANHLVQQFIVSCPSQLLLPTFPNLNVTGWGGSQLATMSTAVGGTTLSLTFPKNVLSPFTGIGSPFTLSSPLFAAFISQNVFGLTYAPVIKTSATTGTVVVPTGQQGVVYMVLTPYSGVANNALTMDQLSAGGTAAGPVAMLVS